MKGTVKLGPAIGGRSEMTKGWEWLYNAYMIPLYFFVIGWLVLLAIFLIVSAFSILQMMRYGLAHVMTYGTTFAFVAVSVLIVLGTLGYLSTVDLKSSVDFGLAGAGLYAPNAEL